MVVPEMLQAWLDAAGKLMPLVEKPSLDRFMRPRLEALEDRQLMAAGILDPTFGHGGTLIGPAFQVGYGYSDNYQQTTHSVLLPDGKLLVMGYGPAPSNYVPGTPLEMFNADGSVDTSFGQNGVLFLNGPLGFNPNQIAVDHSGKIVIGGLIFYPNPGTYSQGNVGLVRLNEDGSFDASFGFGGWMLGTRPIPTQYNGTATLTGMQIEPDNSIVVSVFANSYGVQTGVVLARFTNAGNLDTSFNGSGFVVTSVTPNYNGDLAVQPDGKLLVWSSLNSSIVRYNTDGSLDSSFVDAAPTITGQISSVAVGPDGHIMIGLVSHWDNINGYNEDVVQRFNPDGTLDLNFGTGSIAVAGYINSPNASTLGPIVAVQANGSIVVGVPGLSSAEAVVLRFRADGKIDSTFGSNGSVAFTYSGSSTSFNKITDVLIQPDGKIVIAGESDDNFVGSFFGLARLSGDPVNGPNSVSKVTPPAHVGTGPNSVPGPSLANVSLAVTSAAPTASVAAFALVVPNSALRELQPLATQGGVGSTGSLHLLNTTYFGSGGGAREAAQGDIVEGDRASSGDGRDTNAVFAEFAKDYAVWCA